MKRLFSFFLALLLLPLTTLAFAIETVDSSATVTVANVHLDERSRLVWEAASEKPARVKFYFRFSTPVQLRKSDGTMIPASPGTDFAFKKTLTLPHDPGFMIGKPIVGSTDKTSITVYVLPGEDNAFAKDYDPAARALNDPAEIVLDAKSNEDDVAPVTTPTGACQEKACTTWNEFGDCSNGKHTKTCTTPKCAGKIPDPVTEDCTDSGPITCQSVSCKSDKDEDWNAWSDCTNGQQTSTCKTPTCPGAIVQPRTQACTPAPVLSVEAPTTIVKGSTFTLKAKSSVKVPQLQIDYVYVNGNLKGTFGPCRTATECLANPVDQHYWNIDDKGTGIQYSIVALDNNNKILAQTEEKTIMFTDPTPAPVTCTAIACTTWSDWGTCTSNKQTRTCTTPQCAGKVPEPEQRDCTSAPTQKTNQYWHPEQPLDMEGMKTPGTVMARDTAECRRENSCVRTDGYCTIEGGATSPWTCAQGKFDKCTKNDVCQSVQLSTGATWYCRGSTWVKDRPVGCKSGSADIKTFKLRIHTWGQGDGKTFKSGKIKLLFSNSEVTDATPIEHSYRDYYGSDLDIDIKTDLRYLKLTLLEDGLGMGIATIKIIDPETNQPVHTWDMTGFKYNGWGNDAPAGAIWLASGGQGCWSSGCDRGLGKELLLLSSYRKQEIRQ